MSNTEKENPDSIKSEKCILCGKNAGIPFNEPIDKRKYYIRGSGQLCDNCYYALYPYVLDKYETNIPKVGRFFMFLKTTPGYIVCILIPFLLLILLQGKYSLQGTTQGRYLTGGVPPVRFSM